MVNEKKGNVFLGLIGAILGMVVGLIPVVLIARLTNSIFSLVFALVPICIAFGYYLLGKTGGIPAIIITIILSLVSVFLGDFLITYVMILKEYESSFFEVSIIETAKLYFDRLKEGNTLILKSLGQMFVFMLLGIVIARRFVAGILMKGSSSKTTENTYQGSLQQSGAPQQYSYNPEQGTYPIDGQVNENQTYGTVEQQPQFSQPAPTQADQFSQPENYNSNFMPPQQPQQPPLQQQVGYNSPETTINEGGIVDTTAGVDVPEQPVQGDGFEDTPFK